MKTSTLPQSELQTSTTDLDQERLLITSEDLASVERALRQVAIVEKDDQARCRSLLELAASVRPVGHWGLNE
ncbi:MAG: hypothetical protein JWO95_2123 [Verrucomicrobiales bacterium]|nr:hypothetical protein [Verrucomicrobiales bacterium]